MLVVLVLAACAIRLRGDEEQTNAFVSTDVASDPLATKLRECRSVTPEQKDALSECREAWAEKRRQFLGQKAPSASSGNGSSGSGSSGSRRRPPSGSGWPRSGGMGSGGRS